MPFEEVSISSPVCISTKGVIYSSELNSARVDLSACLQPSQMFNCWHSAWHDFVPVGSPHAIPRPSLGEGNKPLPYRQYVWRHRSVAKWMCVLPHHLSLRQKNKSWTSLIYPYKQRDCIKTVQGLAHWPRGNWVRGF